MRKVIPRLRTQWQSKGWIRTAAYALSYSAWSAGCQLVFLTLITYFLMPSNPRFQDISDVASSNELMITGISGLIFLILLRLFNPLSSTTRDEIFTRMRFERIFTPGLLRGIGLGGAIALAFVLSGLYRYLGFFIHLDEAPLTLAGVLLRVGCLFLMVYAEEFIFRHKILNYLRHQLPDAAAAVGCGILYCLVKTIQFDLGLMQTFTLFLVSVALAFRAMAIGDFAWGAGFWTGLLLVFHPLFSMPIFGADFHGLFLVKYQPSPEGEGLLSRLLTGGAGGPLSSLALQGLLIVDLLQSTKITRRLPAVGKGWKSKLRRLK